MSIVDELTGLYNRTGFLILADHHIKLADRVKEPLTLLFVELDRPSSDDAARRLIVEIGNVIKATNKHATEATAKTSGGLNHRSCKMRSSFDSMTSSSSPATSGVLAARGSKPD